MLGTKKNKPGKQAPISSHPFFAAVVALWFAALLGLGSLVLPVALFEKFVTMTGISSVVSATQPPLGTTARIAIAVFSAIGGAIAGLLVARKVAAAQANAEPGRNVFVKAQPDHAASDSIKTPISAHEELGSESLDEPIVEDTQPDQTYSGKRRSLAVTDDSGPSDYFGHAPLPGGEAQMDQFVEDMPSADLEEEENMDDFEPLEPAEAPLELAEIALEDETSGLASLRLGEDPVAPSTKEPMQSPARPFDAPDAGASRIDIPSVAVDPVADLREELDTMTDQDSAPAEASYNPLGEQFAKAEPDANPFAAPTAAPFSQAPAPASFEEVQASEPAFQTDSAPTAPEFAPAITDQSLNDLGMVELVERFALALQAKADAKAQELAESEAQADGAPLVFQRSGAVPSEPVAAPFTPSRAEDAGNALAQFFAEPAVSPTADPAAVSAAPIPQAMPEPAPQQPQAGTAPAPVAAPTVIPAAAPAAPFVPAAMQPVGFEDEDEEVDETPSLSLSLNTAHQPFARSPEAAANAASTQEVAQTDTNDDDEEENDTAEYSSLLAMRSPFASGQEFVRIDDEPEEAGDAVEPTVVFPGSERRATPAIDGPSRDPFPEAVEGVAPPLRPFDAPGQAKPSGLGNPANPTNSDDTERALRDALEKLQRMSGTG